MKLRIPTRGATKSADTALTPGTRMRSGLVRTYVPCVSSYFSGSCSTDEHGTAGSGQCRPFTASREPA